MTFPVHLGANASSLAGTTSSRLSCQHEPDESRYQNCWVKNCSSHEISDLELSADYHKMRGICFPENKALQTISHKKKNNKCTLQALSCFRHGTYYFAV